MLLLISYLALALCVSFVCSIAEAVLLSVRPAYVTAQIRQQKRGAETLKKLLSNLDKPLAAILTLNTIAHTIGAAGVGAQSAVVFGSSYLGASSAILTFLILVFSEIIPKTLGATYWQTLAPSVGALVLWAMRILHPFVWLSEKLTRAIARSDVSALTFSRDEMAAMAEMGAEEGVLDKNEHKTVNNLLFLHKIPVRAIMTPRSVIFTANAQTTVSNFFKNHAETPFSRIPIYEDTQDHIFAYVLKLDLFQAQANDKFDEPIIKFRRNILAVPESMSVSKTYDQFIKSRSHIAMVVNEYGTAQGIVTLEDVLETLIGIEIKDELDTVEDMQILARKRWEERMTKLNINPKEWS